jgi:hypothetical protein
MDQSRSAQTQPSTQFTTPNFISSGSTSSDNMAPPITESAPVPVIGVEYCASAEPFQLLIVKEILHISDGNFEVKDNAGNIIFKVKGKLATLRGRRVLNDAAGNPIVTIRQKVWFIYLFLFFLLKSTFNHLS